MNKLELIEMVHETSDVPKVVVERVLDGLCGVMKSVFYDGEAITFPGVGKLYAAPTKARKGRNPRTGAEIDIPAGKRMAFTTAKGLKDILKG